MASLRSYYNKRLTEPGRKEGIRQSLYDFQTYLAAGQLSMIFFQVPKGQSGKTLDDTNMVLAGQLPAGWKFIAESLEFYFFPGVSPGAVLANAAPQFTNDVYAVGKSGAVSMTVGSKPYLNEAPLMRFPPKTGLSVQSTLGVATTVAATTPVAEVDYARFSGRPYQLNPVLPLVANLSFSVEVDWKALAALPSGVAGRIGAVLDGILFRE